MYGFRYKFFYTNSHALIYSVAHVISCGKLVKGRGKLVKGRGTGRLVMGNTCTRLFGLLTLGLILIQ